MKARDRFKAFHGGRDVPQYLVLTDTDEDFSFWTSDEKQRICGWTVNEEVFWRNRQEKTING